MRYSGKLGIAEQSEVSPGVWEETITEDDVLGTIEQRTEVLSDNDSVLPRYRTTTSISVLSWPADRSSIRYIPLWGRRWTIGSLVEQFPKGVVYNGEEYHGPTPEPTPDGP
jgi:hypothetical protein